LVPVLVVVLVAAQAAFDFAGGTLLQVLLRVLGLVGPRHDGDERGLFGPVAGRLVLPAPVHGDVEARHRAAGLGRLVVHVPGQAAGDDDLVELGEAGTGGGGLAFGLGSGAHAFTFFFLSFGISTRTVMLRRIESVTRQWWSSLFRTEGVP